MPRYHALAQLTAVLLAAPVAIAAGCGSPSTEQLPLSISNQTSLVITLRVNDRELLFPPGSHEDPIDPSALPLPPWHIDAATQTGRVLTSLDVRPGDVRLSTDSQGHGSASGKAVRVDLSCGRLEIWAGPPLLGPGPPSSFPPNDCDP